MCNALRCALAATLVILLAACAPRIEPRAQPQAVPTAVETAQSIFDQITTLHVDGLPSDEQMRVLGPLLTAELRQALEAARDWQRSEIERMQRAGSEDKPPFVEGDLFSSLFEGAQSSRVLSVAGNDARSVAQIERSYGAGTDRVVWRDRAILRRAGDGWLLVDIEYGGDWAFQAGSGSLAQTLKWRD